MLSFKTFIEKIAMFIMGLVVLFCVFFSCGSALNYSGVTTLSGLSAGGFFAVQLHVAFSESIAGVAVFAGGPFYCALGNVDVALSACMVSKP